MTLRLHLCLVPDLLRRTKEASITTLLRAATTLTAINRQRETGETTLEEQVILFPTVHVVDWKYNVLSIGNPCERSHLIIALESIQGTVIVESDRVFVTSQRNPAGALSMSNQSAG
jgi:hypothetical protein